LSAGVKLWTEISAGAGASDSSIRIRSLMPVICVGTLPPLRLAQCLVAGYRNSVTDLRKRAGIIEITVAVDEESRIACQHGR